MLICKTLKANKHHQSVFSVFPGSCKYYLRVFCFSSHSSCFVAQAFVNGASSGFVPPGISVSARCPVWSGHTSQGLPKLKPEVRSWKLLEPLENFKHLSPSTVCCPPFAGAFLNRLGLGLAILVYRLIRGLVCWKYWKHETATWWPWRKGLTWWIKKLGWFARTQRWLNLRCGNGRGDKEVNISWVKCWNDALPGQLCSTNSARRRCFTGEQRFCKHDLG